MASDTLFEDLMNLPVESTDFQCIKLEDFEEDTLGSCCSSPTRSSSDCASPSNSFCSPTIDSDESDFFTFNVAEKPLKKKQTKPENKVKRNERERRRVRRLAEGFRKLRCVVPGVSKKLSKLQTLQTALQYMMELSEIVTSDCQRTNNMMEEQRVIDAQVYAQQEYQTMYQQRVPPVLPPSNPLSHPPMNWNYNHVQPLQTVPQMNPCIDAYLGPTIEHVPMWYYS